MPGIDSPSEAVDFLPQPSLPEDADRQIFNSNWWRSPHAKGCVDPLNDSGASQAEIRVGYLGPAGTFSHQAAYLTKELIWAQRSRPAKPTLVPSQSFEGLFQSLSAGELESIVLPLVNSSTGLVDIAAEALRPRHGSLVAGGVVDVGVSFDLFGSNKLMARHADIAAYRGMNCFSHPQALSQCAGFMLRLGLVPVRAQSTAAACRRAFDEDGLALAPPLIGEEYNLSVLWSNVGDQGAALTRFLLLGNLRFFKPPRLVAENRRSIWIVDASSVHKQAEKSGYSEMIVGKTGLALVLSRASGVQNEGSLSVSDGYFGNLPWPPSTPIDRATSQARTS